MSEQIEERGLKDEDEVLYCKNHPDRPTRVTCSSCAKPVCPECMVYGPVGIKCRECASLAKSATKAGKPSQFVGAAAYGLAAAIIGGFLVMIIRIPFLGFLIYAGYGYLVGEAVSRGAKGNRGPIFMAISGVCAAIGLLATIATGGLFGLLFAVIAVFVAVARLSGA